jgi:hypothetical protein
MADAHGSARRRVRQRRVGQAEEGGLAGLVGFWVYQFYWLEAGGVAAVAGGAVPGAAAGALAAQAVVPGIAVQRLMRSRVVRISQIALDTGHGVHATAQILADTSA